VTISSDTYGWSHGTVELKLGLYDAATNQLKQTWTASNDSSLGGINVELASQDQTFYPVFDDARIVNRTDLDLDGYARRFDLEFNVDSNISGSFYVKLYEDDILFDDLVWTSPTYSVNGTTSDYHSYTVLTDDHGLYHGTAEFKLELYDAATGQRKQTWTAADDADLGGVKVELTYEDADEHDAQGLIEKGIEKLLTMGKAYFEQRNEHPVLGGAISVEASLFADALTFINPAIMAPVARVLDIAGTTLDFGIYVDLADLLIDGNGDWWTQDGDDGYVTLQLTAGGTLISLSFLPDSPISFSGSLASESVEEFRHGEPQLTGADLLEVDLGYGPLEVSFGAGLSLGFDPSATDWKLDVGVDALSFQGVFLSIDVRRDVLWSLFNSTPLLGGMSNVFLSAIESAVSINLGTGSAPSLASILVSQVTGEALPPVVRWAAEETTGEIVSFDGGYDANDDGVGDGYYPGFAPDWLGSPPAVAPFLTDITVKNTGYLSDDYFVRLREEPSDWFVGAYDGFWPAAWDDKCDVTDVGALATADTSWLIGPESGAVARELVFDLYHDGFGPWANEYLGSYRVTVVPGEPAVEEPEIDVQRGGTDNVHSHAFGQVTLGQSASQVFTVRNEGDAPLTVSQASGLSGPFSINPVNGGGTGDDWIVDAGSTRQFTVTYQPTTRGDHNATLMLSNNDSDEDSYQITFTGTGVSPAEIEVKQNTTLIADNSSVFDFGSVLEGSGGREFIFTINNVGDLNLTVGSVVLDNNIGFQVTQQPNSTVAGGNSTTFRVKLLGDTLGGKSAEVRFSNNDNDENPFNFAVSGEVMDTTSPSVTSVELNGGLSQRSKIASIAITFSEEVALSAGALSLHNDTTGEDFDLSTVPFNATTCTWDTSDVALTDGYYAGTLAAAGVEDTAGNPMADDYEFTFHVLKCDANGDGKVDGGDLAIWQQHYDPLGQNPNTPGMGDWNGDGKVDGGDLALWQQRYNPLGLPAVLMKAGAAPAVAEVEPIGTVQAISQIEQVAGVVEDQAESGSSGSSGLKLMDSGFATGYAATVDLLAFLTDTGQESPATPAGNQEGNPVPSATDVASVPTLLQEAANSETAVNGDSNEHTPMIAPGAAEGSEGKGNDAELSDLDDLVTNILSLPELEVLSSL